MTLHQSTATPPATTGLASDRPPRFSIITACQNDAHAVARCVASVAEQSHPDIEHVVVLLQGHDDTLGQLLAQQHRLTIVFAAAKDTLAQAWNRGLKQASGDIIGFLGPHDTFAHPKVLESVADALRDPWLSALYSDRQRTTAGDSAAARVCRSGAFSRKRLGWGWAPPMNTLFVRRLWLTRIGGFSSQLKAAADYDVMVRLFSQPFFKAQYQQQALVIQSDRAWHWRRLMCQFRSPFEELRSLRQAEVGGLGALGLRYLARLAQALR